MDIQKFETHKLSEPVKNIYTLLKLRLTIFEYETRVVIHFIYSAKSTKYLILAKSRILVYNYNNTDDILTAISTYL